MISMISEYDKLPDGKLFWALKYNDSQIELFQHISIN